MTDVIYNEEKEDEPLGEYDVFGGESTPASGKTFLSPYMVGENLTIQPDGIIRVGQTAYNTGVGWFIGYSDGAYKLSIGDPDGKYLAFDGTNFIINADVLYTAGDFLLKAADTQTSPDFYTSGVYVKKKEIKIARGGTLRISFYIQGQAGTSYKYGRVYRNGVAVGTEQSVYELGGDTFSEDISGWEAGDLVQLYCKTIDDTFPQTHTMYTKNFRIYVSNADLATVNLD